MQTKTWLVAALVLTWVNVAQPLIVGSLVAGGAVAGGSAALLGAASLGAGAIGAGVIGAGALGAAKLKAAGAVGAGAVGAASLGAGAIGAGVIGAGALGAAKLGTAGLVGAGAVGAAALGAGKVGLAKAGLTKVGLATVLGSGHTTTRHYGNQYYGRGGTITISTSGRRYRRATNGITDAQELLLANAFALDQEKPCGLRLVCELATRGPEELEEDEQLILNLLEQPHSRRSMAAPYDDAAALGRSSASATVCAEVYQRCDLSGVEVIELLRGTFTF